MRTFEPIPSAASAAAEKLVAIEKKSTVPPSAVSRIAVGSQPVALTTTTVRSAGGAPARAHRVERRERVAQVGADADVAEAQGGDPIDGLGVDVDGDQRPALRRLACRRERQLAGVAGPQDTHRVAGPRQLTGLRCGGADVVDLERGRRR